MRDPTKTELVFEDLKRCYWEIVNFRRFPRRFRLSFELYIYKSQQLTEAMRSEYKARTGSKWIAASFDHWNANTAAIKQIRNAALHGNPIELEEVVLTIYPVEPPVHHYKPLSSKAHDRGYFVQKGHTLISTPFQEKYISANQGLPLLEKRVDDPKDQRNFLFPVREYVGYVLNWALLDSSSRNEQDDYPETEAVRLVLKSFPIFSRYMDFYRAELVANEFDIYKPKNESEEERRARLDGLEFSDEGGFYLGGHHIPRLVNKVS